MQKDKISKWLGLTTQQFNILEAIISLENQQKKTRPKEIIEEEARLNESSKIQKSNFFSQLKSLQNLGFVNKREGSEYGVDFEMLREALTAAHDSFSIEVGEIDKTRKNIETFFRYNPKNDVPAVSYLDYATMYDKLTALLRKDDCMYMIGIFPRILYAHSPSLMHNHPARRYAQTTWHRCIQEKELGVKYLTYFNMEYLYEKLNRHYQKPKLAYDESKAIISNIESLMEEENLLELYYSDSGHGVGRALPYTKEPREFFLMLRDIRNCGRGAVYINSPELADKFKTLFEEDCARAVDMRSKDGKKVITDLHKRLDDLYSNNVKKPHP